MTILRRLSALTVLFAPALVWAQAPVVAAPKVTRADLAAAYMRVDAVYTQRENAKTLPDSLRAHGGCPHWSHFWTSGRQAGI